jgi:hypothetical protein
MWNQKSINNHNNNIMKRTSKFLILSALILAGVATQAQEIIPLDTNNWVFSGRNVIEQFKGKRAVYNQGGSIKLKNQKFLNGTIEFDLYLKEAQMFPGVVFRVNGNDAEQFFVRPHLSGKADANQAAPSINGITPWQLYFGPRYSFPYTYKYDDWTHVKVVVQDKKAQVYLDHAEEPHLSWNLYLEPQEGEIYIRGGGSQAIHIADVTIDRNNAELKNFSPIERKPIAGLVQEWEISDMFEKKLLEDPENLVEVIKNRKWGRKIQVEEGTAANISRQQLLFDGNPGETVFAKITIRSDKDQIKLFHFGYSDEVITILNGKPIYKGNNKWRSRDYRYLGTVGLFDGMYLHLKKGDNTLLMAVSENFGGWLVTGKFDDESGIKLK